jgi:hypothetical protein
MKNGLHVIAWLCILASCVDNRDQAALEKALYAAGKNRRELEKVLVHYSRPEDSLQRRAAIFLIINMPSHYADYGDEINKYRKVFDIIDTMSYRQDIVTVADRMNAGDSLLRSYGPPDPDRVDRIADIRIVTAAYLITNIDYAFRAWRTASWRKEVTFGDFCEYILPYRIRDEQVQYWRPSSYFQYSRMAQNYHSDSLRRIFYSMRWDLGFENNFTVYFNRYFPFRQSYSDILKGKVGGCETTSLFAASAMRSAGLPVALDFVPHWGNAASIHYMVSLVDHIAPPTVISNENKPINTWYLVDFSSETDGRRHAFSKDEVPKGLEVQYVRTIPKVYRYTFSTDPTLTGIRHNTSQADIPSAFRSGNFKDVTPEYISCSDYTLLVSPSLQKLKAAYLCVFDIAGWKPVAIAEIVHGQALFKNIGHNVLYLPAGYRDGEIIPAGDPFFIDPSARIHTLKIDKSKGIFQHLIRKTALFSYTAYHTEALKGGRFEGGNDPAFQHPVLLDSIRQYPFYMNEVTIRNTGRFRYLRYVAPQTTIGESDNIAEVQFYGPDNKAPLQGRIIGSEGSPGHGIEKAFDNDLSSYYENKAEKNGWIGLDLGVNNRARVARIRFCPRNDTNCIMPDNEYELFYWDGQWNSLGIRKAGSYALDYTNVPAGTIYWLRCHSGGDEERIFTYEGGMQHWW